MASSPVQANAQTLPVSKPWAWTRWRWTDALQNPTAAIPSCPPKEEDLPSGDLNDLRAQGAVLGVGHGPRPPVVAPRHGQEGRHKQGPHHKGVDEDAKDHGEAHLVEEGVAGLRDHPAEREGHDDPGGGDDGARGRNGVDDRRAVFEEEAPPAVRIDPGEEEDVVVQGEPDEHEGARHGVDPDQPALALEAGNVRPLQPPVLEDEDASPQDRQDGQGDGEEELHGYECGSVTQADHGEDNQHGR
mmetsp:Transcript_103662/g.275812  ORF Transcript_103662/g.275812 Transcript_103662/m.275812 type:complete len:244 (-) Transcript_103662:323-1054(-)